MRPFTVPAFPTLPGGPPSSFPAALGPGHSLRHLSGRDVRLWSFSWNSVGFCLGAMSKADFGLYFPPAAAGRRRQPALPGAGSHASWPLPFLQLRLNVLFQRFRKLGFSKPFLPFLFRASSSAWGARLYPSHGAGAVAALGPGIPGPGGFPCGGGKKIAG